MTLSHGYDFSAYQGDTVPKGAFGWVKTSEGISYKNAKFDAQWGSALENWGAPGVYHYAHPEKSTPAKQIAMIASMVQLKAGKHTVMLDLEASELTQKATNEWAAEFGEGLWDTFPGVTTVAYFGGGYATNGTGKGLAKHFDHWMYPQYPGVYRATQGFLQMMFGAGVTDIEEARAINRSSLDSRRFVLGPPKTNWPTSMAEMYIPSGAKDNTGWTGGPSFWQFSDNHAPGAIDASVSSLTAAQILGGGIILKQEENMPGDVPPLHPKERYTYTGVRGAVNVWGIGFDSPERLTYRIAAHKQGGKGKVQETLTVGGPASATDSWPKKATWSVTDTDIDWWSIELVKCEGPTPDWDPTKPDRNGKIVRPFWDASLNK